REAGHPRLPRPLPPGGLPPPDLHDARPGHRGLQPLQRLPRPQGRWPARPPHAQGLLQGQGLRPTPAPPEHWHVDVSYVNIAGTFYYLCSLLDGCSRFIVHWELREAMTEADVEQIMQRARERFPGVTPRIVSDNGPQFIARDFKEFIRICG